MPPSRPAAALLAALIFAGATPAHALFGSSKSRCDPTDNDIEAANLVIGEVEEMERAIIEALRLQTGQLAGYEAQGAAAVTQALDAQTRLLSQVAREVEEAETIRSFTPTSSSCRTVTGAAGFAAGRDGEEAAQASAETLETGRISQDLGVVPPGGATNDSDSRFVLLTGTFCSPARAGQEGCTGPDERHGLDLMPGSLFDQATLQTPEDRQAAIELARNLAAPVVADPIPYDAMTTPAERRQALVARAADARAALAAEYFSQARALRTPAVDLGEWAAAVAPEAGRTASDPLSRYELLEHLASRRYDDPDWFVALEGMATESLLREIARQLAVGLILDWERYRLEERRGAIEATRLAITVEQIRALPGLSGPGSVN